MEATDGVGRNLQFIIESNEDCEALKLALPLRTKNRFWHWEKRLRHDGDFPFGFPVSKGEAEKTSRNFEGLSQVAPDEIAAQAFFAAHMMIEETLKPPQSVELSPDLLEKYGFPTDSSPTPHDNTAA